MNVFKRTLLKFLGASDKEDKLDDDKKVKAKSEKVCQFHQHFTCPFSFWTAFLQLQFGFFATRILALKLLVKCWWNWLKDVDDDEAVEVSNEKPVSDEESESRKKRKKRDANVDESDSESPMDDSDLLQVQL